MAFGWPHWPGSTTHFLVKSAQGHDGGFVGFHNFGGQGTVGELAQGVLKAREAGYGELHRHGDVGGKLFIEDTAVPLFHQQPHPLQ